VLESILGGATPRDRDVAQLVERCGYATAALTALPIPGAELVGVMPIHVGMVVGIGQAYGQQLTRRAAMDLLVQIGGTVGLSLVGSKIASTAGKILLPGLGGLIAAPMVFATTVAIGAVAKTYFANDGEVSEEELRQVYERVKDRAKGAFDPSKTRSEDAQRMAREAAEGGEEEVSATGEKASVDDLAERLAKLDELKEKGLVSDAEYARQRDRILDSI
jgi:uncharacterized protein (DUF697 family)